MAYRAHYSTVPPIPMLATSNGTHSAGGAGKHAGTTGRTRLCGCVP